MLVEYWGGGEWLLWRGRPKQWRKEEEEVVVCILWDVGVVRWGRGIFGLALACLCVRRLPSHTHITCVHHSLTCTDCVRWRNNNYLQKQKGGGAQREGSMDFHQKKEEDKLQPATKNTTPVLQFLYAFIYLFYKIADCWNESLTYEQRFYRPSIWWCSDSSIPVPGSCPVLFLLSSMTCTGSE